MLFKLTLELHVLKSLFLMDIFTAYTIFIDILYLEALFRLDYAHS